MNLHRGDELPDGEVGLLADLILYDENLIKLVESDTMRKCSLGYSCDYVDQGGDTFRQENITINHCCIVPDARAGRHVRIQDSREEGMDWTRLNQQLDTILERLTRAGRKTTDGKRTLLDEVEEIRKGAALTERLTASGVGPSSFAQALREHNATYNQFSEEREAGDKFAADAKRAGQEMQEFYRPKACRKPVTQVADSETDWAERMNRAGARMRGK